MTQKILIVDDSSVIRAALRRAVGVGSKDPREVLEASDGEEALSILEDASVDLVFVDINMPRLNGIRLLQELKRRGHFPDLPVVVVTAHHNVARAAGLRRLGALEVIGKPFRPEQIIEVLNRILPPEESNRAGTPV